MFVERTALLGVWDHHLGGWAIAAKVWLCACFTNKIVRWFKKTAALEAQGLRPVAVAEDFADAQALLVRWPATVFSRWRLLNIKGWLSEGGSFPLQSKDVVIWNQNIDYSNLKGDNFHSNLKKPTSNHGNHGADHVASPACLNMSASCAPDGLELQVPDSHEQTLANINV